MRFRSHTIRSLAGLLMTATLATPLLAAEEPKPGIAWLDNWGKALSSAQKEGRPILLEFYTSWCVYCGKLEKETLGDPRVVSLAKGFVCVKLDADVAKGVAARYRPEGFPTTVVAASNGDELISIGGFRDANVFARVLTVMRDEGPRMSQWIARIDKDPKDIEARESLGRTYLDLGMADRAEEHLAAALKAGPSREAADGGESDEARIQFLLAKAVAAGDDPVRSARMLQKLIDVNPGSPRLPAYYLELGKVYESAGKDSKAKETFAKLEKLFPGTLEADRAEHAKQAEEAKQRS